MHKRRLFAGWTALFIVLTLLHLVGCNRNRIESYTPSEVSSVEEGDTFQPATYWALRWVTTTVVDAPILSAFDFLATQSRDYYIVEWRQDGLVVTQDEVKCALEISEVAGMQVSMPEQFFEYCAARVRMAELSEMTVGADYTSDVLTLYGAQLENPYYEDLPTEADDARVEDSDRDGHPGITSIIEGWLGDGYAEVYVTQRAYTRLTGQIVRSDRIEGYIDQDVDQTVLGASEGDNWASGDGYGTRSDGVPEHNFFVMQALDGPMTCDEMNALPDKDSLFE